MRERKRREKCGQGVNLINLSPYGYASPKHVLALPFLILSETDLENIEKQIGPALRPEYL